MQRLFEAIATVLELDEGRRRLELVFVDGRLVTWYTHAEKERPAALHRFDAATAHVRDVVNAP